MFKQAIDLTRFDDQFRDQTIDEPGDSDNVADGRYAALVEAAELVQSSTGTRCSS